jgi:WD40 repeat protein
MKHEDHVEAAQFSRDGRWVVTASWDKTARVWDAATGQPVSAPMKHGDQLLSAQFSPDGRWVVTASRDKTARVWEAATGQPVSAPLTHGDQVFSAQFGPEERRVVTASGDGTARVWEVAPKAGAALAAVIAHAGEVVAELRLNDLGGMDKLSADEWFRLRDWVEANHPSPEARQFVEWLLAPKATRSPTPFRQSP